MATIDDDRNSVRFNAQITADIFSKEAA